MTPAIHPKSDDDGKPVIIHNPSTPTAPDTWADPAAIATWVLGSPVPAQLNDIRMAPWADAPTTAAGWAEVTGQIAMDEPPMKAKFGKHVASGCVILEPDGRIWIMEPSNHHGGYVRTFPKGRADAGLPLQANAIREVHEETGLRVQITGLLGDFTRTTSVTRLYLAVRIGGSPLDAGWEAQGVHLVPRALLPSVLTHPADQPVLQALAAALTTRRT